jgi:hypothetical protein
MPSERRLERRIVLPDLRRYARPLLLIHGAWHGAWCWEPAMRDLAERGFETHAISLRGHGESDRAPLFNLCGVDDYLSDIRRAIAAISPTPIVVAHSMGGFLMQHYIERDPLPGLVLLCAIPHTGTWRFSRRWVSRHPLALVKTLLTLNGRYLVGTPALAREAFFSPALPEEQVVEYARQLGPESFRMSVEGVTNRPRPHSGETPILVLAAEEDRVFLLDEQRALAAAHGAAFVSIPGAAHDLMLDPAWPQAAESIERAAGEWAGSVAAGAPAMPAPPTADPAP